MQKFWGFKIRLPALHVPQNLFCLSLLVVFGPPRIHPSATETVIVTDSYKLFVTAAPEHRHVNKVLNKGDVFVHGCPWPPALGKEAITCKAAS